MLAQPVAGAFDLDDHGMVKKSVQQGGRDDRIAENLAPFARSRDWRSGSSRLVS